MKYYVVDAFSKDIFHGNQAGVCLLDEPLNDETMQNIAAENNLAETAFVLPKGKDFDLRWFTPEVEIDLCGHATLASAFVLSNFVDTTLAEMKFSTLSGILTVTRKGDLFEMDFPARRPERTDVTALMEKAIGMPILEAYGARDLLLVVESEEQILGAKPDMGLLSRLTDWFGIIVTARGTELDFVSRFFAPNAGIPEDPVTGSSHATLIPFWAERLEKKQMTAGQLSQRGGILYCEACGERVKISGHAVLYLSGEIWLD